MSKKGTRKSGKPGTGPTNKKERGPSIASVCRENIMEGMTWEQSKAVIDKKFPGNKHSKACYYWYRTNMAKNGEKVPALPKREKKVKEKKVKKSKKQKKTTAEALAEAGAPEE